MHTSPQRGLVVDLFAGGGGASVGIEAALGRTVDVAVNHDPVALAVHRANHPATEHMETDVWDVLPEDAVKGRPVEVLWASPDCTHFSVAKGGKPRRQRIRSLAWVVVKWAKAVRPRVIFLENVSEFRGWGPLDRFGHPIKHRMGETFRRWKGQLERLGYEVDYRVLDASLYGAPTRRRRLFLVARRDGLPIRWPEPTHGPGRLKVRTAAECIDWSIPCPSIFERKKPLAEKTLWRIAQGIKRFVLENPQPFIVQVNHSGSTGRSAHVWPSDDPLRTVAASNGFAEEPLGAVTTQGNRFNLVVPVVAGVGGRAGLSPATPGDAPVGTITAKNDRVLVAPSLVKFRGDSTGAPIDGPTPTITAGGQQRPERPATGNPIGIAAATLIQRSWGERKGQRPRALDIEKPLGTVVGQGIKHAAVTAFLAKHFGGVVGVPVDGPTSTITSRDHHSLAAATLVKFRGNEENGHPGCADVEEPMPTLAAQGNHVAEVLAFLTAYYGTDGTQGKGQSVFEPMRTLTAKARLGLVTVEGTEYQIVDIGMRMLEPHELLAAQFGRFAETYDLSAATTKAAKVRLIGNSVCPEVAEAVVAANAGDAASERDVA